MNKKEYKEYLKSEHWKCFKKDYFKRFDKLCFECGCKNKVSLHHKNYLRLWCEKFTDVVALCRFCHARRHGKFVQEVKKVNKQNEPWSKLIRKAKKNVACYVYNQ